MTALRALMIEKTGEAPVAIAIALAAAGSLDALAALATDRGLPARQRATALLAVAIALAAAPNAQVPDDALDACEDPETAAACIEGGLAAALTGVLAAAPVSPLYRATRIAIGRRLLAAGESGPHVIRLLIDAGDRTRAAEAAAADLLRHVGLAPGDTTVAPATPETWARVHLILAWAGDSAFFAAFVRELARAAPTSIEVLADLLDRLPGGDPAAVARAKAGIGWAIDAGGNQRSST